MDDSNEEEIRRRKWWKKENEYVQKHLKQGKEGENRSDPVNELLVTKKKTWG